MMEGDGKMEEKDLETPPPDQQPQAETSAEKNDAEGGDAEFIPKEILQQLPPEAQKVISMQMTALTTGHRSNPVLSKINAQHIDKILELAGEDDKRSHQDIQSSRKYNLVYVLIAAALFMFITLFMADRNPELYGELIKLVAVFGGGFGGGFGFKTYVDRKKPE